MRAGMALVAAALVAPPAAAEVAKAEICTRGADMRAIEVVSPGTVGAACDVVYTRDDGATVSVPYNANVDRDYCRARAAEMAASLVAQGFDCAAKENAEIEAALDGASAAAPNETASEDESLDAQLARIEIGGEREAAPATILPEELRQPTLAPPAAVAANDEPAAEPVQLAQDVREIEYRAPKPPKTSGAGRLVGAQPSIEDLIDVSTTPEAQPTASVEGLPPRAVEDVIRRVLAANAAAWNEGDLGAFMNAYSNSADTLLVDNAVVTAGWAPVKKSFERDIAAAGSMGRFAFSGLDVRMTSDDVATVVGRYSLVRERDPRAGVITLVLKRFDGVWRIVQETRVADNQPRN